MSATERDGARRSAKERDGARRSATERDGARRSATERDGARRSATERDGARRSATERDGARMSANERDGARRSATERDGARSAQRGARGDPTSRPIQAFKHHRSQDRLTYCAAFSNLGVGVSTLRYGKSGRHPQHSNGNSHMALGDRRSEMITAGSALGCARGRHPRLGLAVRCGDLAL